MSRDGGVGCQLELWSQEEAVERGATASLKLEEVGKGGAEPPFEQIRLYMTNLYVKVDPDLYPALSLIRWRKKAQNGRTGKWYASGSVRGKKVLMHRYIMGCSDPTIYIDHRNGDTLDNRRAWNLREFSPLQNAWNRPGEEDRGLNWIPRRLQFRVHITVRGRRVDLGHHDTLALAREARRMGEIIHYGFEMRGGER